MGAPFSLWLVGEQVCDFAGQRLAVWQVERRDRRIPVSDFFNNICK
jgi:hypothetical protein